MPLVTIESATEPAEPSPTVWARAMSAGRQNSLFGAGLTAFRQTEASA